MSAFSSACNRCWALAPSFSVACSIGASIVWMARVCLVTYPALSSISMSVRSKSDINLHYFARQWYTPGRYRVRCICVRYVWECECGFFNFNLRWQPIISIYRHVFGTRGTEHLIGYHRSSRARCAFALSLCRFGPIAIPLPLFTSIAHRLYIEFPQISGWHVAIYAAILLIGYICNAHV